jgi:hypothetical protein
MKRIACIALISSLVFAGIVGCGDKSSTKIEPEITTPGEKTTITTEKDAKQTGDNPPPARP